jgi:hypothetical protein
MRKWLALVLTVFLVLPAPAQAEGGTTLETFNVRLLSEYDRPSMLVLLDFAVATDTPLPTKIDIRVPKEGNITAVAYVSGNQYLNTEFAGPEVDGAWQVVTFFVKEYSTYHLEYYQPLPRDGTERTFKYQWIGDYAVKNFRIDIQVPEDSTGVKSRPMLPFAPSEQFLSSRASRNNLAAGETYQVDLKYSRPGDATVLPSTSLQVTASDPISQNTAGRITLDSLPYILGGVGLLLILGAGYYFLQSRSVHVPKPRKRKTVENDDESENIYCHECGTRAHTEDHFCRACGAKLRTA